ncbi:MAG: alpha/beta fold hydrolase [Deltaproteobacteria bacterium]|nr:alpha/beta fold hydrolase [Deltaproteobacteria bacterium]MBW2359809.1 alpha/beta fold hydrolase [Deltaproteobacteria bacterium]
MSSTEGAERAFDSHAFDLPGDGGAAALCLHGLTGTPYEVRPLGEALSRAGVRAVGPLLPGHGGEPAALRRTPYTAWLDAARAEVLRLHGNHDVVFGVGLSMGGLVTLLLAAECGFDAVVCVGVPLALRQPGAALARFAKYLVRELPKRHGSDICDPEARARHPGMPVMPLAAVAELQKLQRVVRARLTEIHVPLLAAHGARDETAHPGDAETILQKVASAEKQHLLLPGSGHVVPVDFDGPALAAAAVRFLVGRPPHPGRNETVFCNRSRERLTAPLVPS